MAFLSARIGLFISVTLLCLNLPMSKATAQTPVQTDTSRDINRELTSPTYLGDPPPLDRSLSAYGKI